MRHDALKHLRDGTLVSSMSGSPTAPSPTKGYGRLGWSRLLREEISDRSTSPCALDG